MNILQIPIVDEFSASSTSKRDVQFATEKGLWTQNPRRAAAASASSDTNSKTSDGEVDADVVVIPAPSPPPMTPFGEVSV